MRINRTNTYRYNRNSVGNAQLELARDIDSRVEGNANLMNRTLEQCCLITHVAGIFRSRNSIENSRKIYNAIYFHLYTRLEYLGGDCDGR